LGNLVKARIAGSYSDFIMMTCVQDDEIGCKPHEWGIEGLVTNILINANASMKTNNICFITW